MNFDLLLTIVLRLTAAAAMAGLIGIERDIHGRTAGLRTNILISIGAASFMILSELILPDNSAYDRTRMGAQVISGIGFLGAGAIIKNEFSVRGLTTAATIWISAAIGLSCGGGKFFLALAAALISFFCLTVLEYVEHAFSRDFFWICTIDSDLHVDSDQIASLLDISAVTVLSGNTVLDYESCRKTLTYEIRVRDKHARTDIPASIEENIRQKGISVYSISVKKK